MENTKVIQMLLFLDPPYLNCDAMYTANQDFINIYDYIYNYMKL